MLESRMFTEDDTNIFRRLIGGLTREYPDAQQLEYAWVNADTSSPSSVPIVGMGSNLVYFVGARDNQFTLEALNWDTGAADFHYLIGGQRYNVMYSGTAIDEDGRIHYGTPWGRVRLTPKTTSGK